MDQRTILKGFNVYLFIFCKVDLVELYKVKC